MRHIDATRSCRSNKCHIDPLSQQSSIPHLSNVWPTGTPMLDSVKPKSKEKNVWPPNRHMLKIIEQIIRSDSPSPKKQEYYFEMTL